METDASDWIAQRRLSGLSVADMPAELKPASEDDGYRVQAAVIERLSAPDGDRASASKWASRRRRCKPHSDFTRRSVEHCSRTDA